LNGSDLTDYQQKILNYFKKSNHRVLLLYLTVGCGKTLTSLACAREAIKQFPNTEIIILSPKSVQDEFKQNLELLNSFKSYSKSLKQSQIHMIAYNGNNSQTKFEKIINSFNNKNKNYIFIIDELHLFMRGVIKVNLEEGEKTRNIGNCQNIFDMIKQIKNKRIIGLTGTPSAKFPFELVPFFNLENQNQKLFPETVEEFEYLYIDKEHNSFKNIQQLKQKLKGLVVYHELKTNLKINSGIKGNELEEVEVEMSEEQYKQYIIDYYLELQEKSFIKHRNIYGVGYGMASTFHAKTFQDSIYYYDNDYLEQQLTLAYQGKLTKNSKILKHIIHKDKYEICKEIPINLLENVNYQKNTTNKLKSLNQNKIKIDEIHCPKLIKMYNDTKNINGLCVFYFKFVESGVKIMEEVLKHNGITKFNFSQNSSQKYVIFTGNETADYKSKIKKIFNSPENKYGKIIKYMILSSCGAVGITLKNVRYLGIGSVEFNYSMIRQIMGRVNRLGSHNDLKPEEQTLIQKIYLSIKNKKYYNVNYKYINKICYRTTYLYNEKGLCIERIIYQDSIYDDKINEEFRKILKEISI